MPARASALCPLSTGGIVASASTLHIAVVFLTSHHGLSFSSSPSFVTGPLALLSFVRAFVDTMSV